MLSMKHNHQATLYFAKYFIYGKQILSNLIPHILSISSAGDWYSNMLNKSQIVIIIWKKIMHTWANKLLELTGFKKSLRYDVLFFFAAQAVLFTFSLLGAPFIKVTYHKNNLHVCGRRL